MALHPSKEIALLPLCNCLSTGNITSIRDLADGKFLEKTINSTFPEFFKLYGENVTVDICNDATYCEQECKQTDKKDSIKNKLETISIKKEIEAICVKEEPKANCTEKEEIAVDEDDCKKEFVATATIKSEDASTEESENEENVPLCELVKPLQTVDKNILPRFKYIQKFIDERYNLTSEGVISYSKCMDSDSFELAKVAFFVCAEIAQYYVQVQNEVLNTLTHLDWKIQEDIQECLNLLIANRENLSKYEIENVLSHHAEYKVQGHHKSPLVTPRRQCTSMYKRSLPPQTPNEEVFTNSPLKSFFESPIFKKEDINKKVKEVEKVRKRFHAEELKCEDFQSELKDAMQKLQGKDNEIHKLKDHVKELKNEIEELKEKFTASQTSECQNCLREKKEREQKYSHEVFMRNEVVNLHGKIAKLHKEEETLKKIIKTIEKEKKALSSQTASYELKLIEKEEEIYKLKEELAKVQQNLDDALKNESMYRAKLSETITPVKKCPESPVLGENIGSVIEEENRILQDKLKCAEELVKELSQKVQLTEQNQVFYSTNSVNSAMPELLDMSNISETEKFRDSTMHLENYKELNYLSDGCDVLNSSDTAPKQSVISIQYEPKPGAENVCEAVLWRRYDSPSESEKANETSFSGIIDPELSIPGKDYIDMTPVKTGKRSSVLKSTEYLDCTNVSENSKKLFCAAGMCENTKQLDSTEVVAENKKKSECTDVGPENTVQIFSTSVGDNLHPSESFDIFENLNFNMFLESLKKISTNGSFKNVKEVLDKQKSEFSALLKTSATNGSIGFNSQLLLNLITECISAATTSHYNLQDKNCLKSNTISESDIMELDALKREMNEMSEKHSLQLKKMEEEIQHYSNQLKKNEREIQLLSSRIKEKEEDIDNLKRENSHIEIKLKESSQKNNEKSRMIKNYQTEIKERETRLQDVTKKYNNIHKKLKHALESGKSVKKEYDLLLTKVIGIKKNFSIEKESLLTELSNRQDEVKKFHKKVKELNKKIEELNMDLKAKSCNCAVNAKKNSEKLSKTESVFPVENKVIRKCSFNQNSEFILPEFNSTAIHDVGNESTLSGALCNKKKNYSLFVSHDEEDFLNQSSIADIKKEIREEERVEELIRRNSILPVHLQSSYPVEINLPLPSESLYIKNNSSKVRYRHLRERLGSDTEQASKKRKLADAECESIQPGNSSIQTPTTKMRKKFKTPSSLKKLISFSRSQRPGYIKPKP